MEKVFLLEFFFRCSDAFVQRHHGWACFERRQKKPALTSSPHRSHSVYNLGDDVVFPVESKCPPFFMLSYSYTPFHLYHPN